MSITIKSSANIWAMASIAADLVLSMSEQELQQQINLHLQKKTTDYRSKKQIF